MSSAANAKMTRKKFIEALNEDLSREYQAIISYVNYSQVLKGAAYMNVADELAVNAKEELDHALQIAKHVDHAGVVVAMEGAELVEDVVASLDARMAKHLLPGHHVEGDAAEALSDHDARLPCVLAQAGPARGQGLEDLEADLFLDETHAAVAKREVGPAGVKRPVLITVSQAGGRIGTVPLSGV